MFWLSGWFRIQQSQSPETDETESGHSDPAQFIESQHDSTGSWTGEPESIQIDRHFLPRVSGRLGVLAADHGKKLFNF